jgi:predicted O-methyltransferase YrrM
MPDYLELEERAPEGWFSQYDMKVLYPAVAAIPEYGVYLEIGVHKGRSLWVARQAADPTVDVIGIDTEADPQIEGTDFIQADSTKLKIDSNWRVDVLFIDGNHSYEGVKSDINRFVPLVKKGGLVLFHDCDETSPGVVQAVAEYAGNNRLAWQMLKTTDLRSSIARMEV